MTAPHTRCGEEDDVDLGPMEIGLILLAFMALFGYKKLPDASRSLGRSLRILRSEMQGMREDGAPRETAAPLPEVAAPREDDEPRQG